MGVSVKEAIKAAARGVARVMVVPFCVSFTVRAWLLGRDQALMASTQTLALVPGLLGQYVRRAFLQYAIASCHKSVVVEWGTTVSRAGTRLDENAYIGPGCHLGLVHVEHDVLIGAGVHVPSGARTHGIGDVVVPIREQPGRERMIRIGAGAWVGSAAVVLADVGDNTVVGAGAVVTKPLPAAVVAAGVPARVLRTRLSSREAV